MTIDGSSITEQSQDMNTISGSRPSSRARCHPQLTRLGMQQIATLSMALSTLQKYGLSTVKDVDGLRKAASTQSLIKGKQKHSSLVAVKSPVS